MTLEEFVNIKEGEFIVSNTPIDCGSDYLKITYTLPIGVKGQVLAIYYALRRLFVYIESEDIFYNCDYKEWDILK